ncbi:MAG: NTP transferase domain-containing protein [Bullifex sp.]
MRIGLLAAGLSKRMKGTNKLLELLDGKTILEHSVENALSFTDMVTVITGHDSERTERILSRYPVTVIRNPDYEKGQETSLRLLLANVKADILVAPADMPFLTADDYRTAEEKLKGFYSARPFHEKSAGHPVALSEELVKLVPGTEKRIRDLIKELPHCFYEGRAETILDIDTPEMLEELRKR